MPATPAVPSALQRFTAAFLQAFHAYAGWLVSISWRRFLVLALLLLILASAAEKLPLLRWEQSETIERGSGPAGARPTPPKPPSLPPLPSPTSPPVAAPAPPAPPEPPASAASRPFFRVEKAPGSGKEGVEISIDERGVRIRTKPTPSHSASQALPAASQASQAASAAAEGEAALAAARHAQAAAEAALAQTEAAASAAHAALDTARNALPPATTDEVKRVLDQARRDIDDAVREAREVARSAADEARAAVEEARSEAADEADASIHVDADGTLRRVRTLHLGSALGDLAFLWIVASAIIKITYKRQIQAEAQAAQAVETAEAESLKRQVAEARMAAMQAQIEPHFLFNTLASIDHLIEVDPQRASQMQKHLIALLRATMPTMREANGSASVPRDLGRELAVIRPYLEILKVRMEERLATDISVPDGLLSAEFPAMMIQTLVENAIKHGLEPKPEGGRLRVAAEIVHGKLAVSVADTGLGFGKAATAGTGVGLANIRERLALLYGGKASLTVAENPGGGTLVTIAVPYRPIESAAA